MVRFLKFAGIGVVGFLCDAGVFQILITSLTMSPYFAKVLSYFAAATVTWWLNRRFTFASSGITPLSEWARFLGVNALGAVVNCAVFAAVLTHVAAAAEYPVLAVAAGALAGLVFNFVLSQRFVFGLQAARNIGITSRHSS